MLFTLLGLIPGLLNTVNGITNAITNEKIKLANAQTEQERIASQERITSLQAKRDVLIAESGRSNINAVIRGWIGASVAFILSKLLIWDKALGDWTGGHTDALDPNLWQVIMATIGFYFLYEGAVNTARILKA
jgi:hypothetical protein